jgi:arabinose-5-phosphate isomerase
MSIKSNAAKQMISPAPQAHKRHAPDPDSIIATARRVLGQEAEALHAVAARLDRVFSQAIEVIYGIKGRVVVSGMGKSGHVGRKIAATLASTGTPAMFVHPGEASHGDLGMITADDAVLALSNSGEAAELDAILAYSRRFAIPLIAMTGSADNTLARTADLALVLPREPEACPMGLAPTTSTTMMIGLGDALAVALMERRGFSEDDYRTFHPGGQIGRILLKVSEVMHGPEGLPLIAPERPMSQAIIVMTEHGFGCAGVVDGDGRLVGIITDGDLRRHMGNDLTTRTAAQIMTKAPTTVSPQILAAEALKILNDKTRTQLFVVENGKPVGVLHIHDLLRAGIA